MPDDTPSSFLGLLDHSDPLQHAPPADPLAALRDLSGVGAPPIDPEKLKRRLLIPIDDKPDEYILAIDNSSMEKLCQCPRSAEFYLLDRREKPASSALIFGGALHEALEAYYTGRGNEGHEEIMKYFQKQPPMWQDWRTADLCCEVFTRYMSRYPLENEPFRIPRFDADGNESPDGKLAVELPFSVPIGVLDVDQTSGYSASTLVQDQLGNDEPVYIKRIHFMWRGKMDLLLVDPNDNWWVMDHKTTSIAGPSFLDAFVLSQQMFGYVQASRELTKRPIKGLFLNGIVTRKPTKSGKGFDYIREKLHYDDWHLEEHRRDVTAMVGELLTNICQGYFPRKTTWCVGKYGKCSYHDVCAMTTKPSQDVVLNSDLYTPVTWSPLD
tara:strand:+ start:1325 stop:2470 length:1146 start_codon:yes stop_codon:yes gene_type:complete